MSDLSSCPTLIRERKLCVGCGCRDCLGQVEIYDAIAAEVSAVVERKEMLEKKCRILLQVVERIPSYVAEELTESEATDD